MVVAGKPETLRFGSLFVPEWENIGQGNQLFCNERCFYCQGGGRIQKNLFEWKACVPVWHIGSGWWPDGLLTPPSPEAMIWDMDSIKRDGIQHHTQTY